jgi:hypothetical protein
MLARTIEGRGISEVEALEGRHGTAFPEAVAAVRALGRCDVCTYR